MTRYDNWVTQEPEPDPDAEAEQLKDSIVEAVREQRLRPRPTSTFLRELGSLVEELTDAEERAAG